MLVQDAIHGANRAEILPLIEQGGIDLSRYLIDEPFGIELIEDRLPSEGPRAREAVPAAAKQPADGWAGKIDTGTRAPRLGIDKQLLCPPAGKG